MSGSQYQGLGCHTFGYEGDGNPFALGAKDTQFDSVVPDVNELKGMAWIAVGAVVLGAILYFCGPMVGLEFPLIKK